MKKQHVKLISSLLLLALTLPIGALAVETDSMVKADYVKQERLEILFEDKLIEIQENDATKSAIEKRGIEESIISSIKEATDFNGNIYTVAEVDPEGYMIFHNESGKFSEYSPSAPSPYKGYTENLYYGGPAQYYVFDGENYVHTISGDTINAEENEDALADGSEQLFDHYMEEPNLSNTEFIETGKEQPQSRALAATQTYIPGAAMIYNLNTESEMSYCSPGGTNGICGYISSAIMLAWYDTYVNGAIIDNATYFNQARGYNVFAGSPGDYANAGTNYKRTFSYNIWKWCSPLPNNDGSTVAPILVSTINTYLHVNRGISNLSASLSAIPTKSTIKSVINRGRPMVLEGNLAKLWANEPRTNHAVVVYGYSSDDHLIAHMGWADYDNVYLEGLYSFLTTI